MNKYKMATYSLCTLLLGCSNLVEIKERFPASEDCQTLAKALMKGTKKGDVKKGETLSVFSRISIFESGIFELEGSDKIIGKMSLSPDGRFVVVRVNKGKGAQEKSVHHYIVDIEKRKLVSLVKSSFPGDYATELDHVKWSPDSNRLLFTTENQKRLGVHDLETGKTMFILKTMNAPVNNPVWSPDSLSMALIDETKRSINIYDMNPKSQNFSRFQYKHSSNDFESYLALSWDSHFKISVTSSSDLGDREWLLGTKKFNLVPKKQKNESAPEIFLSEHYSIRRMEPNLFVVEALNTKKEFTLNLKDIPNASLLSVSDIVAFDQKVSVVLKNGEIVTIDIP